VTFEHRPVMVDEVTEALAPAAGHVVIDATVGGGGHSHALLSGATPPRAVVGLDRDPAAVEAARQRLAPFGAAARVELSPYRDLLRTLGPEERDDVGGVLFDLGVSSHQLDTAERGFSFRNDGPLDMRMDPSQELTAGHVVNEWAERDLARAIRRFGEERFADRIAASIVAARPFSGTAQLADVVRDAIPAPARRHGGHPARRTFQAIRIVVNAELDDLEQALRDAASLLRPGGALVVLSYHSLEDGITKDVMRSLSEPFSPPGLPVEPAAPAYRRQGKVRRPLPSEVAENPRAEAARMRVLERVAVTAA